MMNSGYTNVVETPLFTADAAMDAEEEGDADDDFMSELSKPAAQQQNPTDRIGAGAGGASRQKKGLLDSDSDDEDFQKNTRKAGGAAVENARGDTFAGAKQAPQKAGIKGLLDSEDSDDEDFKIGKKPPVKQAAAQSKPKPQSKLLMGSDDEESDDGFKPAAKKPPVAAATKAAPAQPTTSKPSAAAKNKNLFGDSDEDSEEELKFKPGASKKEAPKAAPKPQAPAASAQARAAAPQQKQPPQKKKTVKFMDSDGEDSDDFKPPPKPKNAIGGPEQKKATPAPKKAEPTKAKLSELLNRDDQQPTAPNKPPAPKFDNPPTVKPDPKPAGSTESAGANAAAATPPTGAVDEESGERKLTIKEL